MVSLEAQSGPTLAGVSNQVYEIQVMDSQGTWRTIAKVPMTNSNQAITNAGETGLFYRLSSTNQAKP